MLTVLMQLLFFREAKRFLDLYGTRIFFIFLKGRSDPITLSNLAAEGGHASDDCLKT
jgi:hypothetical protein